VEKKGRLKVIIPVDITEDQGSPVKEMSAENYGINPAVIKECIKDCGGSTFKHFTFTFW